MLASIKTIRGIIHVISVTRPGSGSIKAIKTTAPRYMYFLFFLICSVVMIPALTSRTTYVGKVNMKPHNNRVSMTSEKKSENAYVGGRPRRFANKTMAFTVAGTTTVYPRVNPKINRLVKEMTNG